jgi:hypothetical protein
LGGGAACEVGLCGGQGREGGGGEDGFGVHYD